MKPIIYSILLLTAVTYGCSGEKTPAATEPAKSQPGVYAVNPKDEGSIKLAEASVQSADDEIDLTGKIDFDPNKVTHVFPLVNGVTRQIFVSLGDVVRKDQPLAEVFSPDLASAISDLHKATAQRTLADKAVERLHSLADAKIASQKDVLQAESDDAQAKAEYDRALKNLEVLGGSTTTTNTVFIVRAPIEGVVVERNAQPGSQVRNDGSQNLFTIGSTSEVWATLDVYPDQLSRVAVGDSVEIQGSGEENAPKETRIKTISSVMDASTFTAKARCQLQNAGDLLRPQMFVSAKVFHKLDSALYIPATAVFYDGDGKSYVFKKIAEGKYQKTEIQTKKSNSEKAQVASGLQSGDLVVSDQALFLNEEVVGASK
jgi:cobalt-zinc-cadmium efflux system membrane fusion protein